MMNYPFLDFDKLENSYSESLGILEQSFNKILVVGIGGSSQGSKAINHFLNEKRVQYVDHLNSVKINYLLNNTQLNETGFIFVSKSGQTSETLTIFEYMIKKLDGNIDFSKNFYSFTENASSPLRDLSIQKSIKTIESVGKENNLSNVQKAFKENHGLQCGFCTPGFIMTAIECKKNNISTEEEVRDFLDGNFCRCTGYQNIVKSIIYFLKMS